MIYQKKARTRTVSEIPHVYVKEALDPLYGRTEPVATAPDPTLLEQWNKAPNLVHGDFEQGRQAPAGWSPLHADVTWVQETDKGGKSKNRVIRFTMNEDVAGSTGVLYYSDLFPVEEGATYRFQCRWKSTGSAAKVFIKCYDELPTEFRTGRVLAGPRPKDARSTAASRTSKGARGLERADRGLHAPAHPVHPALGTGDALCLLARRHGRMGRYHRQASRTGAGRQRLDRDRTTDGHPRRPRPRARRRRSRRPTVKQLLPSSPRRERIRDRGLVGSRTGSRCRRHVPGRNDRCDP